MDDIIRDLENTPGLYHLRLLFPDEKRRIAEIEESRNLGVHECLRRTNTMVIFHNSRFRPPSAPIVSEDGTFPPVPFPEVKRDDVVSSSPSYAVDRWIRKTLYPDANFPKDSASLIIGFKD